MSVKGKMEEDICDVALKLDGIRNSQKIIHLLKSLAFQIGKEVSFSEFGNHLKMSKNTVERYLDIIT